MVQMKCPVCKDVLLAGVELDEGLPGERCGECGGQWVNGTTYLKWLEPRGPRPPPGRQGFEAVPAEPPVHDNRQAKLCPFCGRFLTRAKVGRGLEFQLDRC